MKSNLNDNVEVILTKFGAETYNNWHAHIQYPGWEPANKKVGDVLKTQLWRLVQAFGEHIHMGMIEVPFLENVIDIEPNTVKVPVNEEEAFAMLLISHKWLSDNSPHVLKMGVV